MLHVKIKRVLHYYKKYTINISEEMENEYSETFDSTFSKREAVTFKNVTRYYYFPWRVQSSTDERQQ